MSATEIMVSKEYHLLREAMGDGIPRFYTAMEEKGVLQHFFSLYQDIFDEGSPIPPLVTQGLMLALSSRCSNNYCFVLHGHNLITNGIPIERIDELVRKLAFPPEVEAHEKWSRVLKWAYFFGNSLGGNPAEKKENDDNIQKLLDKDELFAIFKICTANDISNRFSEFYAQEIGVENEPNFRKENGNLKLEIANLVKFYQTLSAGDQNSARPVVTMCMHCKNIRGADGKWRTLETTLAALDRRSLFSHSICTPCNNKYHAHS